jgi:hypothetical protein
MRTILHAQRRRPPRKSLPVAPRDSRRARFPARHGMRTPCGYLPSLYVV